MYLKRLSFVPIVFILILTFISCNAPKNPQNTKTEFYGISVSFECPLYYQDKFESLKSSRVSKGLAMLKFVSGNSTWDNPHSMLIIDVRKIEEHQDAKSLYMLVNSDSMVNSWHIIDQNDSVKVDNLDAYSFYYSDKDDLYYSLLYLDYRDYVWEFVIISINSRADLARLEFENLVSSIKFP
jgi:hypothetical protein